MPKLCCILLVDDDLTTNYLNRWLLEKLDVTERVAVALNGEEALAVLATECIGTSPTCPALIFLDINMPRMNGFDFLKAYQQLPLINRQAIVIIVLTTSVHPHDLQRLETLPAAGFLNKPLTAAKVHDVLQTHFR
jgi:CheY-like chemotaxis protein